MWSGELAEVIPLSKSRNRQVVPEKVEYFEGVESARFGTSRAVFSPEVSVPGESLRTWIRTDLSDAAALAI
jgi:hypothetical protein